MNHIAIDSTTMTIICFCFLFSRVILAVYENALSFFVFLFFNREIFNIIFKNTSLLLLIFKLFIINLFILLYLIKFSEFKYSTFERL